MESSAGVTTHTTHQPQWMDHGHHFLLDTCSTGVAVAVAGHVVEHPGAF
jgi:hypothetical protein